MDDLIKSMEMFAEYILKRKEESAEYLTSISHYYHLSDLLEQEQGDQKALSSMYLSYELAMKPKEFKKAFKKMLPMAYNKGEHQKLRKSFLNCECNCSELFDYMLETDNKNDIKVSEFILLNLDLIQNDIEPYQLSILVKALKEIELFKAFKLDEHPTNYKREITKLIKDSNKLQLLSKKQMFIKIPFSPFTTIRLLRLLLRKEGVSSHFIKKVDVLFKEVLNREKILPYGKGKLLNSLKEYFDLLNKNVDIKFLTINNIGKYQTYKPHKN